ncbi:phosphate transport system substrate-binding protein [Kineococcus xinjiangensis]|uniref:Phosphate-binding protein n=1 Tax=Kineococcus xinjiangensis TaxID=512762 RepID=A0A2S6ICX0_9ACTN|nr:phosphate ABC transporter substrate-binding protein PstS [Kineococcus xinjiangensis]PPK92065.1 phosphate transport system substrate-binding protein [Kineococcus xinjiangensis]
MKQSLLRRAALPAALVLSLGLGACGAANETTTPAGESSATGGADSGAEALSGAINGAGSSAQQAAMQAWIAGFQGEQPDVTVNYDPSGSGAGREQFLSGAVAFAGSDAYLKDEELEAAKERCNGGDAIDLPIYVSPIAVVYNLPGVAELKLSGPTLAKIFNGSITTWNAPEIAAENPDAQLPATAITPVHRSDKSGTTENFTEYLAAAGEGAWTEEPSGEWKLPGGEAAQGTSGVVSAVKAGEGTIGYADASQAGDLGIVSVKVGEEFVQPTAEAAAAVVDASSQVEGRPEGDIAIDLARDTTEAGAYPIVLVSYHIACTKYEDEQTAELVKSFLGYVASDAGQQEAAKAAGSAPISKKLAATVSDSIESISAGS